MQIIHFTGKDDELSMRAAYERAGVPAYVAAFHHRMQEAYSAADFVIARSGAASLSELAWFGLPALLIPLPARRPRITRPSTRRFSSRQVPRTCSPSVRSPPKLWHNPVLKTVHDPVRLAAMTAAARNLAPGDAASLVVETLEKECLR